NSCISASSSCLEKLSKKWETNIDELYELTRKYDKGFDHLVQGIVNGMRRLVQMKAPRLAKVVVSKCGPLLKESTAYTTSFIGSKPQKPHEVKPMTRELVEHVSFFHFRDFRGIGRTCPGQMMSLKMRTLRNCWSQIANRTCSAASEGESCWNGTNIVRLQHAADDLSLGIKDVRPRPKVSFDYVSVVID
ncbi:hypothetical protein COOONC_03475, partial [Cooperia oncophora]